MLKFYKIKEELMLKPKLKNKKYLKLKFIQFF